MASSGWSGAPNLRTKTMSRGAWRRVAITAPTGTPPRGSARTRGRASCICASRSASNSPASARSAKIRRRIAGFHNAQQSRPTGFRSFDRLLYIAQPVLTEENLLAHEKGGRTKRTMRHRALRVLEQPVLHRLVLDAL